MGLGNNCHVLEGQGNLETDCNDAKMEYFSVAPGPGLTLGYSHVDTEVEPRRQLNPQRKPGSSPLLTAYISTTVGWPAPSKDRAQK